MALIQCADCGRDISDQAPACPNCGGPGAVGATPVVQWEYSDYKVKLSHTSKDGDEMQLTEQAVRLALQELGREGWQVEDATDSRTLSQQGRIEKDITTGFFGGNTVYYRGVRLSLKRAADRSLTTDDALEMNGSAVKAGRHPDGVAPLGRA